MDPSDKNTVRVTILGQSYTLLAQGEVLRLVERNADAEQAIAGAISLYEAKGNAIAAREARDRLDAQVTA